MLLAVEQALPSCKAPCRKPEAKLCHPHEPKWFHITCSDIAEDTLNHYTRKMKNKTRLRSILRKKRKALSPDAFQSYSQHICETIINLPEYKTANHIACYLSAFNEVDLTYLIQDALQANKHIYIPAIIETEVNVMHFFPLTENTELAINKFKIKEPVTEGLEPVPFKKLDLIIVPLVGFDESCHRLGQGGGYYDCYLSQYPLQKKSITSIGVGYEIQKLNTVPREDWDIGLDLIVSEEKTYKP
jgi:5-formyltetrahydrofolate cyclo-ligase